MNAGADKGASGPGRSRVALQRRNVLAGGAGLVLTGLAGRGRVLAASARHDLAIGDTRVSVLSDGTLTLPVSLVLPDVPSAELGTLLAATLPREGFEAETNVTVLSTGNARILIDAGAGMNFMPGLGLLPTRLEAARIAPESITHVVFTHAHPDHLWGAIDEFDEPRFPNATHLISQAEWDYWTDQRTVGRVPEAMQPMAAGAARILKALEARIERRRPGDLVSPGVSLVDTAGHTPGHISVLVESGRLKLLVGGDVLTQHRVSFERPDWTWGTDHDPSRAAAARGAALAMLAAEDMILLGYHLPWPGLGRVTRAGSAYTFVPDPAPTR